MLPVLHKLLGFFPFVSLTRVAEAPHKSRTAKEKRRCLRTFILQIPCRRLSAADFDHHHGLTVNGTHSRALPGARACQAKNCSDRDLYAVVQFGFGGFYESQAS